MNQMVAPPRATLVVVGTGMAGARVVEEILARAPDRYQIRMFGDEPHGTYNRILLSGVLGGFTDPDRLWLKPLEWYESRGVFVHVGVRAQHIDPVKRVVIGADGKVVEPYDHLVLATGSRPLIPPIEGTKKQGVFTFRTLEDCAAIGAWARECDRAVVLGGGLLGLEAARGLLSHDVDVTVVEAGPYLMPQQLDPTGAGVLKKQLEGMGVEVILDSAATDILGDGAVTGVRLRDGREIHADMVIVSCGIRANVEEAKTAGLKVERGIVVDDQLRTSDPNIYAVGECAQHKGVVWGLIDPIADHARVVADVLTGSFPDAAYRGSRPATVLKVMGIDLTAMGDVQGGPDCQVYSHLDPVAGVYKKLVVRKERLIGALVLGAPDTNGALQRLYKSAETLPGPALELLAEGNARDALLAKGGAAADITKLPDDTQICNCNLVCKGTLVAAIQSGKCSVSALGEATNAGTGCGTCQPILHQLVQAYAPPGKAKVDQNKLEVMKKQKDGLDGLPELLRLAENNNWQEMTEDDKQRAKWYGLFFRKTTPGHFMLRLRVDGGRSNAAQFRVIADLSDEYGKGFVDLTTRQQIQLRWFTLADVPEIWRRLDEVGLNSMQTGLDNVRGVISCPVAGVTPHELLDATPIVEEYTRMLLGNKEFTNLPRKFNVTITGCLENCCHAETQDISLVPAYRELDGEQVNGFNVLVGGKQGSGGFVPSLPLDVFVRPEEAARLCKEITLIFRDHGQRATRTKARLRFLINERGLGWFRAELAERWGEPLRKAGTDLRKPHHTDHLGIQPQKGGNLNSVGILVPVGRITTKQLRAVADLADKYGSGDIRLTVQQNLVILNVPDSKLGALTEEPILQELPYDPSPIMRGLVSCTGSDYCHMALIETKGWAIEVARELERRTAGQKIQPLTIHWSGCSAGCGLHQVSTIGLQGCRSRVNGTVVDAAHVCARGATGPDTVVATDLMYDVPCDQLADALLPLVKHLPRK